MNILNIIFTPLYHCEIGIVQNKQIRSIIMQSLLDNLKRLVLKLIQFFSVFLKMKGKALFFIIIKISGKERLD